MNASSDPSESKSPVLKEKPIVPRKASATVAGPGPTVGPAAGNSEKRHVERRRIDQLLYVELSTGNGGIVLDVSEQGCGFLSIAPIWDNEPHFSFAIGGGRQIQGEGRVVWVDQSKKLGGLRFVNATSAFREQVRAWLAEPKAEVSPPQPKTEAEARANILKPIPSRPVKPPAESLLDSPVFRQQVRAWLAEPERNGRQAEPEVQAESQTDLLEPIKSEPIKVQGEAKLDSPAKLRRKQLREEARAKMGAAERGAEAAAWGELRGNLAEERIGQRENSGLVGPGRQMPEEFFLHGPSSRSWPALLRNRKLWRGAAGFAVGGAVALLSVAYRQQAGTVLMRLGRSLAGREEQVRSMAESKAASSAMAAVSAQPSAAEPAVGISDTVEHEAESMNSAKNPEAAKIEEGETMGPGVSPEPAPRNLDATATASNGSPIVRKLSSTEEEHALKDRGRDNQVGAAATGSLETPTPDTQPAGNGAAVKPMTPAQAGEPKKKESHHATPEQLQALWSEVEGGDVSAEVALGELYARGNGVPKSCGQARMLLNSAVKKGSEEARQKLERLGDEGCP